MDGFNPADLLEKALNGDLSLDGDEDAAKPTHETAPTDEPAADEVDKGETQGQQQAQPEEDEPVGAPIASKSGTYQIDYGVLVRTREERNAYRAENEQLKAQLEQLTAAQERNLAAAQDEAQARADAGQAQTQADKNLAAAQDAIDKGVDASIFGDFSEESLAKGIHSLQAQLREQLRAELRAEMAQELEPLKQQRAHAAQSAHYNAIFEKHADAGEIVQSVEFDAWFKGLPSFARDSVAAILDGKSGGTAQQVIEVFDTFKAQSGKAAAPAVQAKADPQKVERRVPVSLSEAAGEQHQDVTQQALAMADANPNALIERMQDMTPEQIERLMNAV